MEKPDQQAEFAKLFDEESDKENKSPESATGEPEDGEGNGGTGSEIPAPGDVPVVAVEIAPKTEGQADAIPAGSAPALQGTSGGDDTEKERQRLKSWEGRLKAMERDLAAKRGEEERSEGEEGESTPELAEAEKIISETFGDDVLNAFKVVARHYSGESAKMAAGEAVESQLAQQRAIEAHFSQIRGEHPDFSDLVNSEKFQSWIDAHPANIAAEYRRICESGSAKDVIDMIHRFKKEAIGVTQPEENKALAQKPADDPGIAAGEGIRSRSGGLQIPQKPAMSGDFDKEWDKVPD